MDEGEKVNLKVYVRVRPVIGNEEGAVDVVGRGVRVRGDVVREFDGVFGAQSEQEEVFDRVVGRRGIEKVAEGYHSTVFLYGQTGSGKTYTAGVSCSASLTPTCGIMPRCIHEIFTLISTDTLHEYKISVEWIQTYQETVQDLLSDTSNNLQIRECPDNGVFLVGSRTVELAKPSDFAALSKKAEKSRVTALTRMNAHSSRSHSCLIITVAKRRTLTEEDHVSGRLASRHVTKGKLCIVDLAGSERLKKSLSEGIRKDEAKAINSSLACLGNVLQALVERSKHVPYRDSKLTRLLQDSLGGSGFASFIVTVSPSAESIFESKNSLLFAERAKLVKNAPRVHLEYDRSARFAEIQSALENRIQILEARNRNLEADLEARKGRSSDSDSETEQSSAAKLREVYKLLRGREYELEVMRNRLQDMEATHSDSKKLAEKLAARDALIVSLRKQVKAPGEVEELKARVRELEDALATSKIEASELDGKNKALLDKLSLLQGERDTLNKTRRGLDTVISDLRKRIKQQEAEHSAAMVKLRSKESVTQSQHEEVVAKYNALKTEMHTYKDEAEAAAAQSKERISNLQAALDSIKDAHKAALREMETAHKQSLTDLKHKYEAREAQLTTELDTEAASLIRLKESASSENHELGNKLHLAVARNELLEKELALGRAEIAALRKDAQEQAEKEAEAQALLRSLQEEVTREQGKRRALEEELRKLSDAVAAEERNSRALSEELRAVSLQEREADEHNKEISRRLAQLKEQLENEKGGHASLQRETQVLECKLEAEKLDCQALKQKVTALQSKNTALEDTVARLQEGEHTLRAHVGRLDEEAAKAHAQHTTAAREMTQEIEQLAAQHKRVNDELRGARDEIRALKEECTESQTCKTELTRVQRQVKEDAAVHGQALAKLEETVASLQADKNKLRMEHNKRFGDMEQVLKQKEQQLEVTRERLEAQLEEERSAFDEQKRTYNGIKHNLLKQISELTTRLQQSDAEKQDKDEQAVRAEEELLDVIRKSDELEAVHNARIARLEEEKRTVEEDLQQEMSFVQQQAELFCQEATTRAFLALEGNAELLRCWSEFRDAFVHNASAMRNLRSECLALTEKVSASEAREASLSRSAKTSEQEVSMLRSKCTVLEERLAKTYEEQRETMRDCNKKVDCQDEKMLQLQKDISEKDASITSLMMTNRKLAEDVAVRTAAITDMQHRIASAEGDLEAARSTVASMDTMNKKLQHALEVNAEDTKGARMLSNTLKEQILRDRDVHKNEISNLKNDLATQEKKLTDLQYKVEEAEMQVNMYKRKVDTSESEVVELERRLTASISERDKLQHAVYSLSQEVNDKEASKEHSESVARSKELEAELCCAHQTLEDKSRLLEAQAEKERELTSQLTKAELRVASLECSVQVSTATIETLRSELHEVRSLLQSKESKKCPPVVDSKQVTIQQQQQFICEAASSRLRVELEEVSALVAVLIAFSSLKQSVINTAEDEVRALLGKERALRATLAEEKERFARLQGEAAKTSVLLRKTLNEVAHKTQCITEQQNAASKLSEDVIKLRTEKDNWQVKYHHQTEMLALERSEYRNRIAQLCADKQQELAAIQGDHERMVQLLREGSPYQPDLVAKKVSQESLLRKSVRVNEAAGRIKMLLLAKSELAQLLGGPKEAGGHEKETHAHQCIEVATQVHCSSSAAATQVQSVGSCAGTQTDTDTRCSTSQTHVVNKDCSAQTHVCVVHEDGSAQTQVVHSDRSAQTHDPTMLTAASVSLQSLRGQVGVEVGLQTEGVRRFDTQVQVEFDVELLAVATCLQSASVRNVETGVQACAMSKVCGVQCAAPCVSEGVQVGTCSASVASQTEACDEPVCLASPYTPERYLLSSTPPTVAARRHSYHVLRDIDSNLKERTPVKCAKGETDEVARLREQVTTLKHMQVETLFIADAQLKRERLLHAKRMASLERRPSSRMATTQTFC